MPCELGAQYGCAEKIAQMSLEPSKAMGLLLEIEIIKICFVFRTGFYSINLMSEKYGSLL